MPRWNPYSSGYGQMKAGQAIKRALAQAGHIASAHDGQADPNVAPAVPKYNLIVPQSNPQNACWNGSEVQVDFIIDKSIGKALNYNLQFDVKFASTDVSGSNLSAYLASSASFVTRIDWLYNNSVVETIYADQLLYESIVFTTDQELAQHSSMWAVDVATANQAKPVTVTVPSPSNKPTPADADYKKTYYLPLSGVFPSAQLFVAGLTGEVRARVYLAPKILCGANGYVTNAKVSVSLVNINMWVEEATMSDEAFNALKEQHRSGVNYRSVIRSRFQKTQPTLTAGQTQQDIMNAFNSDSAGLLVYVQNQNLDPGYFLDRDPLSTLQLLDAGGATLTRVLPGTLLENSITTSQIPISSNFVNSSVFNAYFIPFCSSLSRVLGSGKVLGGLRLTAAESIVINPATTTSGHLENVLSYDYASLHVENGELSWAKTAGEL